MESEALSDSHHHLNLSHQRLEEQNYALKSDQRQLQERADTDGMTGLKNHRFFRERLGEEFDRARRYGGALAVILCDVDHFKQFNDRFCHPAGDAVLQQVAQYLRQNVRPSDCVARYGGEEFAIILPQTSQQGALTLAQRIQASLREAAWAHRTITLSIGIACLGEADTIAQSLVDQADKALYRAKSEGRNRIALAEQAP